MLRHLYRWVRGHELFADSVLAVLLCGVTVTLLAIGRPAPPWWAYPLAAAQTLPLALRRRAPVVVTLAVAPAALASGVAAWPGLPVSLGLVVALHGAAAYATRKHAYWVLLGALVAIPVLLFARSDGVTRTALTMLAALAAWLLGDAGRSRRRAGRESRAKLVAQRGQRTAEASLADVEAWVRTARDVHDHVRDALNVMVVVAEERALAVRAGDTDQADAAHAFDTIAATGRRILTELGTLAGAGPDDPGRAAVPGVIDLADLQQTMRAAGVDVSVSAGPHDPPGAEVQLVVNRVVREALTNALRHAPGRPVEIALFQADNALRLRISNPMPGAPATSGVGAAVGTGGTGLRTMRERARSVGGSVVTTAVDGRFTVDLSVPIEPRTPSTGPG